MSRRWLLLSALLCAALWLALFGDKSPAGVAQAVHSPRTAPARGASPVPAGPARALPVQSLIAVIPREQLISPPGGPDAKTSARRDLFSSRSWVPPVTVAPVQAQAAPAIPYVFLGKKFENGMWEVYLGRGEQTFIAREGQLLEGMWHVDSIAPPALALTYVPLKESQTLVIGESR